jgi:two-component system sensor histidine kinase HydH
MKSARTRILLISFLIAAVTFAYYFTFAENLHNPDYAYYHTLFRDLYFLPLILAGLRFGLKGAISTSLVITALCIPLLLMGWHGLSPTDFNRILEFLVFNCVAAMLGAVSDREKAREKDLRESESLASIGRAVSALAHDMRTPLIAIGGFTRFVQERIRSDDDIRKKLDLVLGATDRLDAMVRDMLDFSKPLKLDFTRKDIGELAQRAVSLLEKPARDKRLTIKTDLGADLPPIEFDSMRMEQVLVNLVSNAIEASPVGGAVLVTTRRRGNEVSVEIADSGPGIPPENREKIFIPFFTTKSRGTGLGLAIVMKIVGSHHGRVEVLENPDGGAVFKISLPVYK